MLAVFLVVYQFGLIGPSEPKLVASFRHGSPCVQGPQERQPPAYSGRAANVWRIGVCLKSKASLSVEPTLESAYRLVNGEWKPLVEGVDTPLDFVKGNDHPFEPGSIGIDQEKPFVMFHYLVGDRSLKLFHNRPIGEWNILDDIKPGEYKFIIRIDTVPTVGDQTLTVILDWFGNPEDFDMVVRTTN